MKEETSKEQKSKQNRVPDRIKLESVDNTITVIQYLPGINYYDIVSRIPIHIQDYYNKDDFTDKPKGIITFAPAMAVRQGYYRYFLDYLSNLGYLVYSFDYSGIDESKMDTVKQSNITVKQWISDIQTTVDWVIENSTNQLAEYLGSDLNGPNLSELPNYYLCHSLGGQLFGFLENQNLFDKFVAVTSQNGYWRFYKNKYRYFFFWYLLVPILVKLYGYFPSKTVGFGENLPPKVMRSWKKWCTSENYFFDDPDYSQLAKYDQFKNEILTVTFEDDPWATPEAVDDLYDRYINSNRAHKHYHPKNYELEEIGHLGFFRPKSIEIWNEICDWLE